MIDDQAVREALRRQWGRIAAAARKAAAAGRTEFGRHVAEVDDALAAADLALTVSTLQGRIRLTDYLRTRCVEAVVHGRDLRPAVEPDPVAETVVVQCLTVLLDDRSRDLALELPSETFIDMATGRIPATGPLAQVMPLMT